MQRKLEERRIDREERRREVALMVLDDVVEFIKERCSVDHHTNDVIEGPINN